MLTALSLRSGLEFGVLAYAGSLPVRSERHHIAVRARSSLARHSGKAATLKALKKLKGCLCANPPEEQLPLFQIHCTDFRRSMDGARAQVGPCTVHP